MSLRKKTERTKAVILCQFLEGMNQASGGSSLLLHHQQNTRWMKFRAMVEALHKICVAHAVDPMLKPKPRDLTQ